MLLRLLRIFWKFRDTVSSSPEQLFTGLLAVFSGLLGGKTKLIVRPTYRECAILHSVCLADPGAGKSAAFDVVSRPLDECRLRDLIVDRYTQAGLFDHLSNERHGGVALLISSELGKFLESVLKKQVEIAGERQLFCRLHDGTMWSRVTGNSDRMEVENPYVIIGGYSQPEPFIETCLNLTSRNDGFPDRLLLSTPPSVALHEEEIDEWNELLSDLYSNAKDVYRKFANEIADKLNEQWKERKWTDGKLSKDKKTVLRLALNLHVLYFALGEEISGTIPTTVPMVISAEFMTQAVELTAAQRACYEKRCNTLKEDERLQDYPEELKRRILLHPGPYVKPRN
ncbi:hypothetical protein ACROYT_G033307 [Oculina patagonica]